ncbi:MAG: EamA family transporter [bacterium]|nr:EamA family transporter [bacterium]
MKPIVLAVLAGLCWGIGEVFTRSVLHSKEIGPFAAVAVRSTVALPVIWLAYYVAMNVVKSPMEVQGWLGGASTATWFKLVIGSGLVAGAAAMIFFYAALSMGEVSRIKPVAFALAPATAVVLGWLTLGESLTLRKIIAIGLIIAGVVMLTGKAKSPADAPEEADQSTRTNS